MSIYFLSEQPSAPCRYRGALGIIGHKMKWFAPLVIPYYHWLQTTAGQGTVGAAINPLC